MKATDHIGPMQWRISEIMEGYSYDVNKNSLKVVPRACYWHYTLSLILPDT